MKKIKIVTDSSSDLLSLEGIDFESVPLTINTSEKEYIDNKDLEVLEMVKDLRSYNGKSGTACPSTGTWLNAFEGYDEIYVITITSKLSGSYNSACLAKDIYLEDNPNTNIHVFDSLSTGPEMVLLAEKLVELISCKLEFKEVINKANSYLESTELFFCLESIHNLAMNGRVSKLSDMATRVLNIRIVGKALDGVLHVMNKCRGFRKSFNTLLENIYNTGYNGGKVIISHVNNLDFANKIKDALLEKYQNINIKIHEARALVSYYAEEGGLLIGVETK